MKSVVPA